jgi:hypothetical protein
MATDDKPGFSLSRWSQRKLAAARAAEQPAAPKPANVAPAAAAPMAPSARAAEGASAAAPELPAVESLTFESDFTAFLGPKVDEALRRRALRTLFRDPRFNVMDGLDVYIDDYTKFETLTPEMVKQLAHTKYIFAPPPTRVNEQGYVEDVPEQELAAAATRDAPPLAQPDAPTALAMESNGSGVATLPAADAEAPVVVTPKAVDSENADAPDNEGAAPPGSR